MERKTHATIVMLGSLYGMRRQQGLAPSLEVQLAPEGQPALDLARALELPIDKLGTIYHNHRPASLQQTIRPGDRVAFIPTSLPGPQNGPLGFPLSALEVEPPLVAQG